MIEYKTKSLGLPLTTKVPETYDEFDTLAKKPNAALGAAIKQVVAHVQLGDFRDLFLHGRKREPATDTKAEVPEIIGVEDVTGIARKTKAVTGKDGKPKMKDGEPVTVYAESHDDYFDRVIAQLVEEKKFSDEDRARSSFQALADECMAATPFDPSVSERASSGPKKLAPKWKTAAAKSLTLGNVDKVNAQMLSLINKPFTPTGDMSKVYTGKFPNKDGSETDFTVSDKDAEAYGWLLKEYFDWKSEQDRLASPLNG